MRHLKTKHVTVPLKRPLLVNDDNIDDPFDPDVPASTRASVSTGSSRVLSDAAGPSASNLPKQSAITQYISKPISLTKSKAIDLQITSFIVKHFHPFSLVEETEFHGWTSINNQHYTALTIHFLNSETKLCSRLIDCIDYNEQSTSVELANFLMATVKAWNIEHKISAVVTDNASNLVCAVKKNNWTFGDMSHALLMSLISAFSVNHQKQMGLPDLKLIQECKTRWNSAYHMMKRILKLKEPMLSTLAITNNDLNCITEEEW
ncbi:uncharacterized protein LOC111027250 [Myzus persicae]|uniref:uncharacterized protein LOC111027250 n=1 Tax=Myzus persicae TaxID=13164 RepID=UPI000B9340A0|nr:uncharacterized protein LOC111027250 [Myzus persicae]